MAMNSKLFYLKDTGTKKQKILYFKRKIGFSSILKKNKKQAFYFLGREIKVQINYDLFVKKPQIIYSNQKLIANIPAGYSFTQDEIYNFWLKHKAKIYIPKRVKELSKLTGFNYNRVTIRSQKTRWGSCSASGSLSFNYRLLKFSEKVVDYVIVHELCHLKELNHSKRFWKLVEKFCPDYKSLKRELRYLTLGICADLSLNICHIYFISPKIFP